MIYAVPTTKAKQFLVENKHIIATDEAEAVAMACGEAMVTGNKPIVIMGENGFLNALDVLITLVGMYKIPIDLRVYVREDELQHALVAKGVKDIINIYNIEATIL